MMIFPNVRNVPKVAKQQQAYISHVIVSHMITGPIPYTMFMVPERDVKLKVGDLLLRKDKRYKTLAMEIC